MHRCAFSEASGGFRDLVRKGRPPRSPRSDDHTPVHILEPPKLRNPPLLFRHDAADARGSVFSSRKFLLSSPRIDDRAGTQIRISPESDHFPA